MAFDPAKTAALLIDEGLSNADVATGVAIVEAESSHIEDAEHENEDGTIDWGIWQLNSKYHPKEDALDPAEATKRAVASKGSGDWTNWSVYENGKYKIHRKLGWVSLRLSKCQTDKDDLKQELLVKTDALET